MPQQVLLRQLTRRLRPGTLAGFWQVEFRTVHPWLNLRYSQWFYIDGADAHVPKPCNCAMQGSYTLQPWNHVANSAYTQPPPPQVSALLLLCFHFAMCMSIGGACDGS